MLLGRAIEPINKLNCSQYESGYLIDPEGYCWRSRGKMGLIKDRMDITGARWGLDRAEAILKLRSLKVSGDLHAYLAFHFEQEHQRNYPGPPVPVEMDRAT